MAGRLAPGPNLLYVLDAMLGWLRSAGFSDADALSATRMLAMYVQGFTLQEQLPMSALEAHGASAEKATAAVAEAFRSAPEDQYPNVVALADLIVPGGMDEQFAFGVDQMIEGLRTRLAAKP
jgi:hypothetical protein